MANHDPKEPDSMEGSEPTAFDIPEPIPAVERSLELPAVIIGDRGEKDSAPRVRLLPGRVPESWVLYPAYTLTLFSGILCAHWAIQSGELNPYVMLLSFLLLFCWYWVYGIAYRYRRPLMKLLALGMSTFTAASLVFLTLLRASSLYVPGDDGLITRGSQPTLVVAALLTALSLVAIFGHVFYLGRGYREKTPLSSTPASKSTPDPSIDVE